MYICTGADLRADGRSAYAGGHDCSGCLRHPALQMDHTWYYSYFIHTYMHTYIHTVYIFMHDFVRVYTEHTFIHFQL